MTNRNIDLLSNRDMFVKYANVVEVIRNTKIKISHYGNCNYVKYNTEYNSFNIVSATPNVKGIEKFVGIIHELAHVLFQSPFIATKNLLRIWKLHDESYQLFFNAFNVLEDQRIESHMGKMYLKHANRFDKTTKKLGKLMKEEHVMEDNPVNMLLSIRFQRGDDIKKLKNYKIYKKAIKDVVLTDKYGALRVLVILKPYIDEWIEKQNQNGMKEWERGRMNNLYVDNSNDESGESEFAEAPNDLKDPNKLTNDDLDDMLNKSKEKGSKIVNEMFESIKNSGDLKKIPKNTCIIKRDIGKVSSNKKIVKGMNKIFRKLMMKHGEFIDNYGDEVDVDAYVEGLVSGNDMSNCRINKKPIHGVSIVISIDGSSSMEGNRIKNARNLVATMYKSIKTIDNVDIRANVWAGNSYGITGITEINNEDDIKYITSSRREFFSTPIHTALDYSTNMIKHMKGARKMIIIITDGVPNHFNGGYRVSKDVYMKTCKKSLVKSLNVTKNIICIVVQESHYFKYNPIKMLFKGDKIMNVENMNKASERVIKQFKRMVMNSLV